MTKSSVNRNVFIAVVGMDAFYCARQSRKRLEGTVRCLRWRMIDGESGNAVLLCSACIGHL